VVTGGFVTTAWGIRLSARSPVPSFVVAILLAALWAGRAARRSSFQAELARFERVCLERWQWTVATIAVAALATSATFHTFSATGADAAGYLSYARLLQGGRLVAAEPLAERATWADAPATLAALGWRPGRQPIEQVPTYAIGLPLVLVPALALGGDVAASLMLPLTFALLIIASAAIAQRLAGAVAAVTTAVWLATSPVALVHAMQIMSDVPVTAAWMAGWWLVFRRQWRAAGLAIAVAVLIRPNLAPLAALPLLFVAFDTVSGRPVLRSAGPVLVAGAVVAFLQWRYFGSPLRSGYGTAEEIYALSNVWPNTALYTRWLIETHGPWLLLAPLALLMSRRELLWLFVFAAGVVAAYLAYAVFEAWTYLRFLLPAMTVAMLAVAVIVAEAHRRLPVAIRLPVVVGTLLALMTMNLAAAREHGVFRFADRQARGRLLGSHLASNTSEHAIFISGEHSGVVRYYTGRSVLRWDLMDVQAMEPALEQLRADGHELWVALDDWEEPLFRQKFPRLASVSIDHRPAFESRTGVPVRARAWRVRGARPER
jgi:hypothetical protein